MKKEKYTLNGPGIPKNPQEKNALFKFADVFLDHFWKLITLNLLYAVFYIPLLAALWTAGKVEDETTMLALIGVLLVVQAVVIGPATCGFMKVLRNMSQSRPVFMAHDFFKTFRENLKQGIAMGFVDVIFCTAVFVAIPVYQHMSDQNSAFFIPYVICIALCFIFLIMHFYIYLLIVSTNLSLFKILKNSFYLTAIALKQNLITLVFAVLILFLTILFYPISFFFLPFLPLSLLGLIICYNSFPVIRKYVIQPFYDSRGEKNPEFAYLDAGDDDRVFEDAAEIESQTPAEEKKTLTGVFDKNKDKSASKPKKIIK